MHVYQLSIFFLSAACLCSLLGLASPVYRDNLFMCIGMSLLAIGTASRVVDLVSNQPDIPWDWFFVHSGIGMFAIGKVFHLYLSERKRRFAVFAQSTFNRLHRWPEPIRATNTAMSRNNAADERGPR